MKARQKSKPELEFTTTKFNVHGLGEVIGCSLEFGCDLFFIADLDVYIEALKEWKDMRQAFKDKDLITDNYNTWFFEPKDEIERERGYTL